MVRVGINRALHFTVDVDVATPSSLSHTASTHPRTTTDDALFLFFSRRAKGQEHDASQTQSRDSTGQSRSNHRPFLLSQNSFSISLPSPSRGFPAPAPAPTPTPAHPHKHPFHSLYPTPTQHATLSPKTQATRE